MPGFDQSGPTGQGPMSGRGRGRRANSETNRKGQQTGTEGQSRPLISE